MITFASDELLVAALVGYRQRLRMIDEKIHEIRSELSGVGQVAVVSVVSNGPTSKRNLSPEAKARIAAGQKRRWAAFHKKQSPETAVEKAPVKKRKLSAAGRAAIVAATKKRWAAVRAQKSTAAKKAPATKAAPKRKLSPARKAALVANLAKARTARAAKKTSGEAVPF